MDNEAPIIIAESILGNLISKIMVLTVTGKLELVKNNLDVNAIITSSEEI